MDSLFPELKCVIFTFLQDYTVICQYVCREWRELTKDLKKSMNWLTNSAAFEGRFSLVQWAAPKINCHDLTQTSIRSGNFSQTKWLFDYEDKLGKIERNRWPWLVEGAIYARDLSLVKFFCESKQQWQLDPSYLSIPVRANEFEIFKYLHSIGTPISNYCLHEIVAINNLLFLQYLDEIGKELKIDMYIYAVRLVHFDVLEWAFNRPQHQKYDCQWLHWDAISNAPLDKFKEMEEWLLNHGVPWRNGECTTAIYSLANDETIIEKIKILRELGVQWDGRECWGAMVHKKPAVLKWLLENNCPFCEIDLKESEKPHFEWAREMFPNFSSRHL